MAATDACREGGEQLYRVFIAGMSGWKLVCARDEEHAKTKKKRATAARIVRPSSWWQEQKALGLCPVPKRRRRR